MGSLLSTQSLKRKADDDLGLSMGRPKKRHHNHACAKCGAPMLPLPYENKGQVIPYLPDDVHLAIPSYMDESDRVRDLRSLVCTSRRFSRLHVKRYLEEAGFNVVIEAGPNVPEEDRKAFVVLSKVNSCEALSVWRRSHRFRSLHSMELRMSHYLGSTTYMLRSFGDFLRSLPPAFSNITEFHLVIEGPERMQLRRLLANIHRSGIQCLTLESSSNLLAEPIYDIVKAHENPSLETLSFSGIFPYHPPILPWTRTMCSQINVHTLRLTRAHLPAGKWAALLHGLRICKLADFEVDISIAFDILLNFLSMNQSIQYLTVLQGENPSTIMDLTPGCGKKTDMPNLRCLDGPATFQLAFFNHMSAPLHMVSMVVRSDGGKLESSTLTKLLARSPRITTLTVHFPSSTNGASFANKSWLRIESLLTSISTLIVYDGAVKLDKTAQKVLMMNLVKWISLFPSLSEVEIHHRGHADYRANLVSCTRLGDENIFIFYF